MEAFESKAARACAVHEIPGLVVSTYSRDDKKQYSRAIGYTCLPHGNDDSGKKMTLDTPMVVASATKLPTCIAVMQCVEKKLLHLDDPVAPILPELANPEVMHPFLDIHGNPAPRVPPITLRMLLTHTSGLSYVTDPNMRDHFPQIIDLDSLTRFINARNATDMQPYIPEMQQALRCQFEHTALLHDPCVRWRYSTGIDWAGRMVERVTDMSLEAYCRKNIFDPLGMHRTSFRVSHPEIKGKIATLYFRNKVTGVCEPTEPTHMSDEDFGGHGLITTCNDYMCLLTALTDKYNSIVLKSDTIDYMFSCRTGLPQAMLTDIKTKWLYGTIPEDAPVEHCLVGAVIDYPPSVPGTAMPSKGTVMWMGANSIFWWIDPVKHVCGFYASHIVTRGDRGVNRDMFTAFQKAFYSSLTKRRSSKL